MNRTRLLAVVVAFLLVGGIASAQLSGNYTIDASQPTAGTNFTSFVDAANALATQGVGAPVSFVVAPSVTPYAGFALPTAIVGASPTNPIVFSASGTVVLSGAAVGFTQTIHLGSNVTGTLGGPSDITLDGFDVTGAAAGAGIMISGCANITVRRCRVSSCGSGICAVQSTNVVIEENEVFGVGTTPGTPGSTAYTGGITSYYNNNGCTIQRNKVRDCSGIGIFVGTSGNTTMPLNNVVVNNFVWNCPGTGSYPGGIAIRRSLGSIFANNSVSMPAGSTAGGIHLMVAGAGVTPTVIANNIVQHNGSGPCFRFESSTVIPPTTFDHNLYDVGPGATLGAVGTVTTTTLAAWQTLTAPNLVGLEANTVVAPAGFLSPTDLHITPSSAAFDSGLGLPQVSVDIDLETRPFGSLPDRGADETPAAGLFASFTASVASGAAPLLVSFTDTSFTTAAAITSWAWDFQNDGLVDSTAQNPSFVYGCPGTYSVALTVTDGVNTPSTLVRPNLITIAPAQLTVVSSGLGVGDLTITPVPTTCYPSTVQGWTLVSLSGGTSAVGSGPLLGLYPDATTVAFITFPGSIGNPIHFFPAPGAYPNAGTLALPAGTATGLSGINLDAVELLVDASFGIVFYSNVSRTTL